MKKYVLLAIFTCIISPKLYAPLTLDGTDQDIKELTNKVKKFFNKYNIFEKKFQTTLTRIVNDGLFLFEQSSEDLGKISTTLSNLLTEAYSAQKTDAALKLVVDLFKQYKDINNFSIKFIRTAKEDIIETVLNAKIHTNELVSDNYSRIDQKIITPLLELQSAFISITPPPAAAIRFAAEAEPAKKGVGKAIWTETKGIISEIGAPIAKESIRGIFDLARDALGIQRGATPTEVEKISAEKIAAQRATLEEKLAIAEEAYANLGASLNSPLDEFIDSLKTKVARELEKLTEIKTLKDSLIDLNKKITDQLTPTTTKLQAAVAIIKPYSEATKTLLTVASNAAKIANTFIMQIIEAAEELGITITGSDRIESTHTSLQRMVRDISSKITEISNTFETQFAPLVKPAIAAPRPTTPSTTVPSYQQPITTQPGYQQPAPYQPGQQPYQPVGKPSVVYNEVGFIIPNPEQGKTYYLDQSGQRPIVWQW